MCEHAPSDKIVSGGACRADKFHRPVNRVCPPQEVLRTVYRAGMCGWQGTGEHVLSDKLTSNGVCGTDRFYNSPIRVWCRKV